jgi:hypothetical protein
MQRALGAAEALARDLELWHELAIVHQLRSVIRFFRGEHERSFETRKVSLECARYLQDYTREEPLPFNDSVIAQGRALADFGRGGRDAKLVETLRQLRDHAIASCLWFQLPAIDSALSKSGIEPAPAKPSADGRS